MNLDAIKNIFKQYIEITKEYCDKVLDILDINNNLIKTVILYCIIEFF